jgi:hypothetical protein
MWIGACGLISLLKYICNLANAVAAVIGKVFSIILAVLERVQYVLDICFSKENLWRLSYATFAVVYYCLLVDMGYF